jgi:hypothetical protein
MVGKKVIIRLTSGGQPVTGTIEGYKQAIATIEPIDEPKKAFTL